MPKTILITFVVSSLLFINLSTSALALDHTLITKQELKSSGFGEYESINPNLLSFLRESVNRYNSLLGKLILISKDDAPKEKLPIYINVLKNLQDRYNNESAYRLLIQEAIDSTRRLI